MSPLFILVVTLVMVIGGVLVLRLHPFLVLIAAALAVAGLTPREAVERFELRKDALRVESVGEGGGTVRVRDTSRRLEGGTVQQVRRLAEGSSPRRIGEGVVEVVEGPGGEPGWWRWVGWEAAEGEAIRPGDYLVAPAAVRSAARVSGMTLGQRVAEGFGRTALDIGILIAMASILGSCLMAARGAERIVRSVQSAVGVRRTPLAFLGSGFLLGIPMFAEAVFYLLLPLAKAMWAGTRERYVLCVLSIVAGATMTHSLVPPTPGPLFVASELGVPIAVMMLAGCVVGAVSAVFGYGYAVWADRRWRIPLRDAALAGGGEEGGGDGGGGGLPGLWPSLLPVVLPVVLISAAAVMASYPQVGFPGWLRAVVAGLGDKNLALTVSAGLAMGLLAVRAGGDGGRVRGVIRTAVVEAGEIILVIAAGGALGQALRQAGMAELAGAAMPGRTLALLPLAWGITCLIRVAQGSATVAMITAVGILAPMVGAVDLGYHPVYVALAIGCGSKPGMWMNDSGFWVISKMSGLTEGETLRTASVMVCVEGCVGLVATVLLAWWLPWV